MYTNDNNLNLPTLYRRGFLEIQDWFNEKEKSMSGMQYFLEFLKKKSSFLGYNAKSPGDKVILLKAGTGSGKSTSIPPEIFHNVVNGKLNILCGEPTVMVTKEKVFDILEQKGDIFSKLKFGENLGFETGVDYKRISKKGIIYATHGTIRQKLISMNFKDFSLRYKFIIIDEFHQRSLDIEQILIFMKKKLEEHWRNDYCTTLICMSATFEATKFIKFFDIPKENFINVRGSPNFPVLDIYPKFPIANLVNYIMDVIKKIHIENIDDINDGEYRNIIIFGPTKKWLENIQIKINMFNKEMYDISFEELMKKYNINKKVKIDVKKQYFISSLIMTSETYNEGEINYKKYLTDTDRIKEFITVGDKNIHIIPSRKIILGSNVAETGMTFKHIKYCIDTGLENEVTYLNDLQCVLRVVKDISYFSVQQRKGRIGRTYPGVWYPCFTKEMEKKMELEKLPSIITQSFQTFLLSLIIENSKTKIDFAYETDVNKENIENGLIFRKHINDNNSWYKITSTDVIETGKMDFITTPPYKYFNSTLQLLLMYGYINFNYEPTIYALLSRIVPKLDIFQFKMIISGYFYDANIIDIITIVCAMRENIQELMYRKRNPLHLQKKDSIFYSNYIFMDDFIEYIFIFDEINELIYQLSNNCDNFASFLNNKNIISIMKEWCEKNDLKYKSVINVLLFKQDLINKFIENGLNPFYNKYNIKNYSLSNLLRHNLSEGLEEIKKIKYCIYEGYKYHLAYLNNDDYYLYNNSLKIRINSSLCKSNNIDNTFQSRPKYIIVYNPSLTLQRVSDKWKFELSSSKVSVLDCYVNIDITYNKN